MREPVAGFERVGERAVLVRVVDSPTALALAQDLRQRWGQRVEDVVAGATTVLVDGITPAQADELGHELSGWTADCTRAPGPLVRIGVEYDGADLAQVGRLWGVSEREVVARHTGTEFSAAFTGFAPGFAYLAGNRWPVPRLATPRPQVPAGAVGLADAWCGIYPRSSPGGWQLIGHTDQVLWDLDRTPPAVLAPGTRVRFEAL